MRWLELVMSGHELVSVDIWMMTAAEERDAWRVILHVFEEKIGNNRAMFHRFGLRDKRRGNDPGSEVAQRVG